ncbi:CDP-diacylglycerol--serine O-phosphatidyltransferase [Desulfobaculum bizertense]|uniref:CDP-diacylglycerol--serine O-phosphatidyltransferase n=1 Tax=Desulfobaculum bizertense DSM 18034 TaxID=1121442 RepID=A0A1T4VQ82_9BACT|nr:CDP-diacylglycerol--serine O-phosphatidyltransferase [Desulfobaculum bizertense]UIJ38161.1 CDP-diacylglycerol--serine O-phosphatidyltransferase [Desulfobaculum bizertense]SKA66651.1 CDP-diacylglycerol--serine O-phosphatidyltransferase [Desulfobaculum bizertense DSM 18034]
MHAEKHKPVRKGVYVLPNLFTTASLFAGFMGMMWAFEGRFEMCGIAILLSGLCDGLDGKVARLTGTSSDFGVQYDSLADLVAFGVTPAILTYQWLLHDYGRLGLMASFLIIACGALRLARFNVAAPTASKKYFIGLPIPAQACTFATLVLFAPYIPAEMQRFLPGFVLVLTYVLSYLMVSRVRYISFKEYGFLKAHPFSSAVTATLIFVMVASEPKVLGFVGMFAYIVSGPVLSLMLMRRTSMCDAQEKLS